MSWSTADWVEGDGTTPLFDLITDALDAHPAWELAGGSTEYSDTDPSPDPIYTAREYHITVYRNLGTLNSSGVDFYVALIRILERSADGEPLIDTGYFLAVGAEDYDDTTKYARRPVGLTNVGGIPDANGVLVDGWYPWLSYRLEEPDLTTYGDWRSQGNASPPANLNVLTNHYMSWTNGSAVSVGAQTEPPSAYLQFGAVRVTNDGVLYFMWPDGESYGFIKYAQYIGICDQTRVPAALRSPAGLMSFGMPGYADWSVYGSQMQGTPLSRYPGASQESFWVGGDFLESPSLTGVGYYSGAGTDREQFPFPNLEPYVAMPWGGVAAGGGWNLGDPVHGAMWCVPGLYLLSSEGAPGTWSWFDTMTNADTGNTCLVAPIYDGGLWFLIDTEMD